MQGMIVGGDARSRDLTSLLRKEGAAVSHALETQPQIDWQQLGQMDFVVLPANFLGGVVRGQAGQVSGIEIARHLKRGAQLYCGKADEAMREQCKRGEVLLIEMLQDPVFVHQNALLTAEAAVMRAIALTEETLYQSQCAVIGAAASGECHRWIHTGFHRRYSAQGPCCVKSSADDCTVYGGRGTAQDGGPENTF